MRLGDNRAQRDEAEIPEEVERELEALDAALRGDEIPAEMEGLETLVSDLRQERPEPRAGFGAELDEWAARGFPRGRRPGARPAADSAGGLGAFLARFGAAGSRGWAPVAAAAATLVVIGVFISQLGDFGGEDTGGVAAQGEGAVTQAEPATAAPDEGADVTTLEDALEETGGAEGGGTAARGLPGAMELDQRDGALDAQRSTQNFTRKDNGANRAQEKRRVDRDAQLTLSAPAAEVSGLNAEVIDVIEGANGVVLSSRLTGTEDFARATLDVRVPSATLDDTLAALSDLADVKSRSETATDITKEYVTAKDRLVGLRAERDNLAARIREAATDAEVAQLQAQLANVNRSIATARTELGEVETRAQLATLTIVITSEGASSDGEDDGWSFGDALGDAGRVLEVVAGVALISAAVLVPLAIIAAIGYVTVAAMNRRARERALDD
jgi:hypothetical protein